jgi:hypothetical protein
MDTHYKRECSGPGSDAGPVPPDPFPSSKPPLPNPQPPHPPTRPPIPTLLVSVFIVTWFYLLGMWSTGSAQLASSPLPAQQPPVVSSPIPQPPVVISPVPSAGASAGSGTSAKIITPATTNRLAPNFRGAGRGLPGMPGGPPLNSSLGARDPRPPTVGPLFCDPVVDFPC